MEDLIWPCASAWLARGDEPAVVHVAGVPTVILAAVAGFAERGNR